MNNNDIKPFYIYTDKNCLYIKNINEHSDKIANNIFYYCANIDFANNIHICAIDKHGKLVHFTNKNGYWRKKILCKSFNNIKCIKEMRSYIIDDFLNVFAVENYPLSEDLFKVSHFNFNLKNFKASKYIKEHIYKLNIDDSSNIIFEYKLLNKFDRSFSDNIIIFNNNNKTWLTPNHMLRGSNNTQIDETNIKDDIFEYCYSIKYKV
ncbi:MAG: hypothetical protein RSD47_04165 [Romboutsia sp.]